MKCENIINFHQHNFDLHLYKRVNYLKKSSKSISGKPSSLTILTALKYVPPIVGIGASAGGLDALEDFFKHVTLLSGIAYVVIQHLDPTKQSMLPELLQRVTLMKVVQAGNRMKVLPNHVYVIPPNKDLSVAHGSLFLTPAVAVRGLRVPIDFFFIALAKDRHEHAVGVILSGMGSDGTLGLKAIKEYAGLGFAQSPECAQYDSMPRSAIEGGFVDVVAPASELAGLILVNIKQERLVISDNVETELELRSHSALQQIFRMLVKRTGNNFSLYKKSTIHRRIDRRMLVHKIATIALYASYLRENPQELDLLFKELLIGVTSFFRNPLIWEQFKTLIFPALIAENSHGKALRAWVTACSTGEEAYSLAMIFKDAMRELKPKKKFSLQIFATDLDEDAITFARNGIYSSSILADVSSTQLSHYFVKNGSGYRIHKEIREMVIFAQQNIIMDPPFTKLDILTCRNLLIYFEPELQKKLIPLFHYSLNPYGVLLLGNAETIGGFNRLFSAIDIKSKLYNRINNSVQVTDVDFPTRVFPVISLTEEEPTKATKMNTSITNPIPNLQSMADQILLQNFAPAAVLVNTEGDILYINGRTGKYLEPAAGSTNWNIHAMAREGLRYELGKALEKAQNQVEAVYIPNLKIDTDGGEQIINLKVQAIDSPAVLRGKLMVVFTDISKSAKLRRKTVSATQNEILDELQHAHEQIQALRDEMQTSQEELKSTNEEFQSTNEELQSTNEELTTSKEEMQSLNEELQTVNAELQTKVDDLSWVNNDMQNLLNSTEIATVFLDNTLKLRRFTPQATDLFKLIPGDVGRPLSDIVNILDYANLQQDASQVLRTLAFVENQICTHNKRWFKVRIMPYRTQDNVINGVVITFTEISDLKKIEDKLLKYTNK